MWINFSWVDFAQPFVGIRVRAFGRFRSHISSGAAGWALGFISRDRAPWFYRKALALTRSDA